MKQFLFLLIIILPGCSNSDTDDIIRHEVRLREARRNDSLIKMDEVKKIWTADTLSVYYTADIISKSQNRTINDSLFFIKNKDGAIMPLLRNPQTDK